MDKEYYKINIGLYLFHDNKKIKDGELTFDIHFMEKLDDYKYVFREKLTDIITATVGEDWAINFIQTDMLTAHFFVDIYLDNPEHFNVIRRLVSEGVGEDFRLDYFLRGNVNAYIGNR